MTSRPVSDSGPAALVKESIAGGGGWQCPSDGVRVQSKCKY